MLTEVVQVPALRTRGSAAVTGRRRLERSRPTGAARMCSSGCCAAPTRCSMRNCRRRCSPWSNARSRRCPELHDALEPDDPRHRRPRRHRRTDPAARRDPNATVLPPTDERPTAAAPSTEQSAPSTVSAPDRERDQADAGGRPGQELRAGGDRSPLVPVVGVARLLFANPRRRHRPRVRNRRATASSCRRRTSPARCTWAMRSSTR